MANTFNTVSVTETATLIVAANSRRKGGFVRNLGTGNIFWGFTSSVTIANGMLLEPGEVLNNSGLADSWRGNIFGIAEAGNTEDIRFNEWEQ